MPERGPLHSVSRGHLDALTDTVGIMQHASGSQPDPAHGYCTDDVARSLQVDLLHQHELGWDTVAASAWRNLYFLEEALDPATGRFRNFRRADGSWLDGIGSEDCHGRALLALGEVMAGAPDARLAQSAARLFSRAVPAAQELGALRARASSLLGCLAAMQATRTEATANAARLLAGELKSTFDSRPASTWPWPEARLTYQNALPVQAMIVGGHALGWPTMTDIGLTALDWLIDEQTSTSGHLSPVGNGWWPRGGEKSRFDQQPIEATALLLAAEAAHLVTGDDKYVATIELAYGWFLGQNDTGLPIADPDHGASFDGLTSDGVNVNQGAESTLMWLIALEHVRRMRAGSTAAEPSGHGVLVTSPR